MTPNILIGLVCGIAAIFLTVSLLRDLFVSIYMQGYERGRKDSEAWIVRLETDVDQARQQIWRESEKREPGVQP